MTVFLISSFIAFCTTSAPAEVADVTGKGEVKVVDYEGLEAYLGKYRDQTVVLNFWATWCVPCVKELPFLEQVTATYPEDQVVVILVSLDFSNQLNSRLKPFIKKHRLRSKVVLLDDPDQNIWIDKVDPGWGGAIPVTLIRKGDRKTFHANAFTSFDELDTIIQSFLNS